MYNFQSSVANAKSCFWFEFLKVLYETLFRHVYVFLPIPLSYLSNHLQHVNFFSLSLAILLKTSNNTKEIRVLCNVSSDATLI